VLAKKLSGGKGRGRKKKRTRLVWRRGGKTRGRGNQKKKQILIPGKKKLITPVPQGGKKTDLSRGGGEHLNHKGGAQSGGRKKTWKTSLFGERGTGVFSKEKRKVKNL